MNSTQNVEFTGNVRKQFIGAWNAKYNLCPLVKLPHVKSAQNFNISDEKKWAKMSFTEDRTALL
jgi:hypothetical protein